ncbi:hypothetical protein ACFV9E_04295 [Streptomyces sp. NPDC059835]|uniref:hypothetical protein n=1 Tax=Streptomyces sp. NPDC059835 TaxID=3346967 RepID=UPI00364A0837
MDTLEHEDVRTGGDGREDLLHLVRKAARPEPDGGRVETRLAVCELCGGGTDEFEVAALEAYCVGCCIPIGITVGLQCAHDGALHLYVDNARVVKKETAGAPAQ